MIGGKGLDGTVDSLDTRIFPLHLGLVVGIASVSPENHSVNVLICGFEHLQELFLCYELHIVRIGLPVVVLRPDVADDLLVRIMANKNITAILAFI